MGCDVWSMQVTNLKALLTVGFATCLVVANVTAAKIAWFTFPLVGSVAVPAGFVAIGVAFLFTDLLGEFYGKEQARNTVNATIFGLVLAWVLIYVSISMPAAPFYGLESEFSNVLGGSATIITASILTTLVSQNIDVSIFHRVKSYTGTSHKWARNLFSTGVSQFVDTTLFIVLGFALLPPVLGGSVTPLAALPGMIIGQYVAKLIIAGLDTPVFYAITKLVGGE